jgi:FixJ family two-component response regulator
VGAFDFLFSSPISSRTLIHTVERAKPHQVEARRTEIQLSNFATPLPATAHLAASTFQSFRLND